MTRVKTKRGFSWAVLAAVFIAAIALFFGGTLTAYAAALPTDGTYTCTYSIGDTSSMGESMIGQNIDSTVKVEVKNGVYYVSISYKTSSGMSNLTLGLSGNVGKMQTTNGDKTTITYTLSDASVQNKLPFSVYVSAMDRTTSFSIKLNLSSATKVSDTIEDIGERPAEFVPVITTDASAEYGAQSGSGHYFIIPSATAKIGNDDCSVTASVTLNGEAVEITDGKFMTETPGNYVLTYRAESDKYKTSEGNNTFAEYVVTVRATAEASEIAKFADSDKVPDGLALLVGIARSGSTVYEKASKAMETVSLKYDVFTVELIGAGGAVVSELDEYVEIDLKANMTIDRTKAEVYRLKEDGGVEKVSAKGAGRYVRIETNQGGTYIVCEPGIPFVMPMWGYCIIIVGCILLASVALIFILKARNKKRMAANAERKDETEDISENI